MWQGPSWHPPSLLRLHPSAAVGSLRPCGTSSGGGIALPEHAFSCHCMTSSPEQVTAGDVIAIDKASGKVRAPRSTTECVGGMGCVAVARSLSVQRWRHVQRHSQALVAGAFVQHSSASVCAEGWRTPAVSPPHSIPPSGHQAGPLVCAVTRLRCDGCAGKLTDASLRLFWGCCVWFLNASHGGSCRTLGWKPAGSAWLFEGVLPAPACPLLQAPPPSLCSAPRASCRSGGRWCTSSRCTRWAGALQGLK